MEIVKDSRTYERVGFAGRLRAARELAEMTQATLAERIGKDQSQVSQWERGVCLPKPGTSIRLALALQVNPVWLRWGDESNAPR